VGKHKGKKLPSQGTPDWNHFSPDSGAPDGQTLDHVAPLDTPKVATGQVNAGSGDIAVSPNALVVVANALDQLVSTVSDAIDTLDGVDVQPGAPNFKAAKAVKSKADGGGSVTDDLKTLYTQNLTKMHDSFAQLSQGLKGMAQDYTTTEDLNKLTAQQVEAIMNDASSYMANGSGGSSAGQSSLGSTPPAAPPSVADIMSQMGLSPNGVAPTGVGQSSIDPSTGQPVVTSQGSKTPAPDAGTGTTGSGQVPPATDSGSTGTGSGGPVGPLSGLGGGVPPTSSGGQDQGQSAAAPQTDSGSSGGQGESAAPAQTDSSTGSSAGQVPTAPASGSGGTGSGGPVVPLAGLGGGGLGGGVPPTSSGGQGQSAAMPQTGSGSSLGQSGGQGQGESAVAPQTDSSTGSSAGQVPPATDSGSTATGSDGQTGSTAHDTASSTPTSSDAHKPHVVVDAVLKPVNTLHSDGHGHMTVEQDVPIVAHLTQSIPLDPSHTPDTGSAPTPADAPAPANGPHPHVVVDAVLKPQITIHQDASGQLVQEIDRTVLAHVVVEPGQPTPDPTTAV
jgi:hypothetical protein